MEFIKAFTLSLGEVEEPVLTLYQAGVIAHKLFRDKQYKGEQLNRLQKEYIEANDFKRYLRTLEDEGILTTYRGLPSTVFTLLGRSHDSVEDIACTVDPFCYVSHLSAMAHHGLTNRLPSKLYISSPSPSKWKIFALEKMEKDLGGDFDIYLSNGMPLLKKSKLEKISRKDIHRFNSLHLGAYKNVRGREMRVSTIGRTFLDMLKNPELCGGINHVLEVFEEHAPRYLRLILDEIDQHGGDIDKVRAGYILDERLGIDDPRINAWISFAQRGGSRKLDASAEYIPEWSEKWCLSLNIFE